MPPVIDFLRLENAAIGGHVVATVENPDGQLLRGETVADRGQLRSPPSALPRNTVAVDAAAFGEQFAAASDGAAVSPMIFWVKGLAAKSGDQSA